MHTNAQSCIAIKKFKESLCVSIFLFCLFNISIAQQPPYTFRHISQSEGLMHNDVRGIAQDRKGFIWIMTPNGLQRYDGSRFVNYPYDITNPVGIGDTRSSNLFSDTANNCLWITTPYFQKLDLEKQQFTTHTVEEILNDRSFVFNRYKSPTNSDWLVGDFGLFELSEKTKKLIPYPSSYSVHTLNANKSSSSFTDTQTGDTWMVGFWSGLSWFHKKTKKVYTHKYNPLRNELLKVMDQAGLMSIMMDSEANIWVSTTKSTFYRWSSSQNKLFVYSLKDDQPGNTHVANKVTTKNVICFFEDNHHTIWAGTENAGLLQYNREKDSFLTITNNEAAREGLHYHYTIRTIFQDREENIWLGTDKGVNLFNPYRQYFQSIHHEEGNLSSLPKNEINCVIQARNGDMIVGSWGGGITIFDSDWHFKKNISFDKPFEYDLIWSFMETDDGKIWAGSQHGYIHVYNPLSEMVERTFQPPEMGAMTIRCMTKDGAGNIWMGLHNGKIAKWDNTTKRFYAYNDGLKGLPQTFSPVLNIFFDSKGRCWVSTIYGFKQFDTEQRTYSAVYLPEPNNPHSISAFQTEGIEEYDDSTLVIGTANGGLNFFQPLTRQFTHLTTRDGLPDGSIHALKKDNNHIWFTTDFGLYKFRCGTKEFVRYLTEQGIITSSFTATGFYPQQNGNWMTATSSEIISFSPQKYVQQYQPESRLEITGFRVFDNLLSIDSILTIDKPVRLRYTKNFITIEFAILQYFNLQQNNYYYQLSSVDENWVEAGTKNFATYTNLQPGEYVFSVKAGNGSNVTKPTSFAIIIEPPFWRTIWFYLLLTAAACALALSLIRLREKNIKKVQAEKLKVQQLSADHYRNQLELEQIVNYFSSSLIDKSTVDDALWDVAKNLIGRLGFVDCMIYLWNSDKTKMVQRAGYGPKGSIEEIEKNLFDVLPGQGIVGYVMETTEAVLIPDTSKDLRYRVDEMVRLSEITVPIVHNNKLIGIIDCEHPDKNFFTLQHLQVLNTIAALIGTKIKSIESEQSLLQARIEMLGINEKLSEAKLEALRSQLNPHFIFNCLNSIDDLIQNNEKEKATAYLAKFARLIRNILETSKSNVIPCWKDIETLKVYLELEELRCDNSFTYHIDVAEEILNGDYKVPPLVIQPFVENAIHHGLLNKKESDKQLRIAVRVEGNSIQYIIEDNGVGRDLSAAYNSLNKPAHQSMGMQLTTERINLFNRENNGAIIITDLYDKQNKPAGTRVEVKLINP